LERESIGKSPKCGFRTVEKWYEHEPVVENDGHKILLDFSIQTDHLIQARRPVWW
jgi:hypothetical protein